MKMVSRISPFVLNRISKIYGFKLYSVKPCSSVYKSIAAYHVKTSKGELLIKPYIGTPSRLAGIAANVKKLHKRGFRNMPDWLLTLSGKQWVKLTGQLYYVTDWVDGHALGTRKSDLKRLGGALAKLHRMTKSITHGSIPPLYYSINVLRNNNRIFKQNLPLVQEKQTEMGQWFRDHGERCLSLGDEMRRTIRRPEIRRLLRHEVKHSSLTHGDITCPNVIIGSKRLQLIDWERVSKNTIYYEIAKALSNTADYSSSRMRALLHGYERVHPLHLNERLLISALFRFPREACYVCKSAEAEKQLFPILRDTWKQRLAAIEWLDNWASK